MELTELLKSFKSGDFARPNLFQVEIPYLGDSFNVKCKAATMPPGNVESIDVGYMNRKIKVAGDRTFEDWTVTIYGDDAHETRQQILDWQAMAHSQGNEITGDTPADYKKTGVIRQISRNGKTITKEHTVVGIWPKIVGEIALDWDTNNEIETFEVTFALDWWE